MLIQLKDDVEGQHLIPLPGSGTMKRIFSHIGPPLSLMGSHSIKPAHCCPCWLRTKTWAAAGTCALMSSSAVFLKDGSCVESCGEDVITHEGGKPLGFLLTRNER